MLVDKLITSAPYYDDVATAETKNYYRMLFVPGRAVQARELTQIQSLQYAQNKRLGDHLFKNGSIVIPGDISFDTGFISITLNVSGLSSPTKTNLQSETYRKTNIIGQFLSDGTNLAQISFADSVDLNTLKVYVKYTKGGAAADQFIVTDVLNIVNASATVLFASLPVTAVGTATSASITEGIFYVNGVFAAVHAQAKIVAQTSTPSLSIGLTVEERIVTESTDSSLVDPAQGFSNYNAPGAHRYQLNLNLTAGSISPSTNPDYIELLILEDGIATKLVKRTAYNVLADELARRTFDESGDYTVRPFIASIEEHSNPAKLKIAIEAGKAYVKGYEIETIAKKYINDLDKARDFDSENNKTITALVGNYIDVKLPASSFEDFPNIGTHGSANIYDLNGVNIGSFNVRQILPIGSIYNPVTAQTETWFRVSIFNVLINSGKSFAQAFSCGSATNRFLIRQDVIELTGTISISGTTVTGVGTRFITSNDNPLAAGQKILYSDTGGAWEYNTIATVSSDIAATVSNAEALATVSGSKIYLAYAEIKNTGSARALYRLPHQKIKEISDANYIYQKRVTGTGGTNTVTINPGGGDEFVSSNPSDYILYNSTTSTYLPITSITSFSTSSATLNVASGISAGNNIIVNCKVRIPSVTVKGKTASTNQTYVFAASGVNASASKAEFWIPVADVYNIVKVEEGATDITDRYEFDNGQRDSFYDLGKLTLKRGQTVPTGTVTVTYDYFVHSSGTFFSVDSYSSYDSVPTYVSKTDGQVFDLRDCLDFRPTMNSTRTGFLYTSKFPVDFVSIDYEYYLNRIDKLVLDNKGNFKVIKGISSLDPVPPRTPDNAMALYNLMLRAYTLTPKDCIVEYIENKRYTMRDIGKLENRISNLEYYTTLSLLEKETADLEYLDENGQNRFKNGFIVDPFNGHGIGDVTSPEYRCSIDMQRGECRPMFTQNLIDLEPDVLTNVEKTGDLITLPYTEVGFIEQKWATEFINVNPYNVFTFLGRLELTPPFDQWKETSVLPDLIVNQEGNFDSMVAVSNAYGTVWDEWETHWTGSKTTTKKSRKLTAVGNNAPDFQHGTNWPRQYTTTTTTTTTKSGMATRSGTQLTVVPEIVTTNLGESVVDVSYIPFMRSIDVKFVAKGFKPGTRLYAFFDNVNVSAHCSAGTTFNPSAPISTTPLVTDNTGKAEGVFRIPSSDSLRFRTGERLFTLTDDPNNSELLRTTFGSETFSAEGLLETKQSTILSTRNARLVASAVVDQKNVTDTKTKVSTVTKWEDPLAQSFLIGEKGGCFLSSVDLFFQSKDPNIPVIIYISETVNGYPSQTVVPFSQVVVDSSSVVVTPTTSTLQSHEIAATNIKFPSPVYLQEGREYALVIISNSNNYNMWIATGGKKQIGTEVPMTSQPYAGSLFKSQNASTWTAQQESDLKFKLYKCEFETNSVKTVEFVNSEVGSRRIDKISYMKPVTSGSANTIIRVDLKNHGLIAGDYITLSGATTIGDVSNTVLNGTHTVTTAGLNWVEFQVPSITHTGGTGSQYTLIVGDATVVRAITNLPYDDLFISARTINFTETSLDFEIDYHLAAHQHDNASLSSHYSPVTGVPCAVNQTLIFNDGRKVFSSTNNESFHSSVKSFRLHGELFSTNPNLSPVIDVRGLSCTTIEHKIGREFGDLAPGNTVPLVYNGSAAANHTANTLTISAPFAAPDIKPGTTITLDATTASNDSTYIVLNRTDSAGTTVFQFDPSTPLAATATETVSIFLRQDLIREYNASEGTAESKQLTRSFSLANPADSIKVQFAAYWPSSFNLDVYYRTVPVYGGGNIKERRWIKMTADNIAYSSGQDDYREFTFSADGIEEFSALQTKIVMNMVPSGSRLITSNVPKLRDLRVIALS